MLAPWSFCVSECAKWQWAGSIRWKWWRDGHESGQLALFMLVHSLACTDASTPIPPLHPAGPERKGSLLFPHNGSRRDAKPLKTKALAGGYFRKCRVCWERKGKVDKQAFRMAFLMLVTKNEENYFSIYSDSNWDLTNEYIMSKKQSHSPMKKLLLCKGPEPPTILRPDSFNCCCSEGEVRFGGRVREGGDAQNPGLRVCSTRAENTFPAKSSSCLGSFRRV